MPSEIKNKKWTKMIGGLQWREHWVKQGGGLETRKTSWGDNEWGADSDCNQGGAADNLCTPNQVGRIGFKSEFVDLEAGISFGPPPGYKAQHVKRTWSGGKLLKAAWALWTSVTSYSAPARIQYTREKYGSNGLGHVQIEMDEAHNSVGMEERLGHQHYRREGERRSSDEIGPELNMGEYSGNTSRDGQTNGLTNVVIGLENKNSDGEGVQMLSKSLILLNKEKDDGLAHKEEQKHAVNSRAIDVNDLECEKQSRGAKRGEKSLLLSKCTKVAETEIIRRREGTSCSRESEETVGDGHCELQQESETELNERQEDEIEALKSLTVAYGLGILPNNEDEFVDSFVNKRAELRREQKEAKGKRVICTRSVTAKTRNLQ